MGIKVGDKVISKSMDYSITRRGKGYGIVTKVGVEINPFYRSINMDWYMINGISYKNVPAKYRDFELLEEAGKELKKFKKTQMEMG